MFAGASASHMTADEAPTPSSSPAKQQGSKAKKSSKSDKALKSLYAKYLKSQIETNAAERRRHESAEKIHRLKEVYLINKNLKLELELCVLQQRMAVYDRKAVSGNVGAICALHDN